MRGLMRAEVIKLSKRGVLPVTAVVMMLLTALSALILLILPDVAPDAIEGLEKVSRGDASILGVQTVTSQTWFPLILAVVMFGSELSRNAWAAALTRESRRSFHVLARLVVFTAAAVIVAAATVVLWEILAIFFTEGRVEYGVVGWLGVSWKLVLVQTTWVSLGLAAITLLRSTGIAIGVVVAYSFVDGLLALWEPYGEIALTPATAALFGDVSAEVTAGLGGGGSVIGFTQALIVVLAWVVVGISLALVGVRYREA